MCSNSNTTSLEELFFDRGDPTSQRVFSGVGCSEEVGKHAKSLGTHALVVTDPGVMSAGHPQKIIASLEDAGVKAHLFEGTVENPTDSSVQECARKVESLGIDLIVGVGGGSSLDTAKGANFILTNGGTMKDYWGVGKATNPLLPMIAIPTTAGTGSECQSYALISEDRTHQKMACGTPSALPRITLLDPELTLSQPFSVSAATGMDALAHALESAVCTKRNLLSCRHATMGFTLLVQNLKTVLEESDNLAAREAVLLGAAHAGAAIERSMLGAAHALANPLTARKGVIHGRAVGLTLPAVLAYNQEDPAISAIYADLARIAGLADARASDQKATHLMLEKVLFLRNLAKLPTSLAEVGSEHSDLEQLAKDAAEQWTGTFNPKRVGEAEFYQIYQSIDEFAEGPSIG